MDKIWAQHIKMDYVWSKLKKRPQAKKGPHKISRILHVHFTVLHNPKFVAISHNSFKIDLFMDTWGIANNKI